MIHRCTNLWLGAAVLLWTIAAHADGLAGVTSIERCGWFDNPSANNATLTDRDGEWTVAMQGETSAEGEWPAFKPSQWVRTGTGSYGYGCACLKVRERKDERRITHILKARAKDLAACRHDKVLTEPENPIKAGKR